MSKKRTSKKKTSKTSASKKPTSKKIKRRASKPRKGSKRPFKQTGSRGVRASQARANKAKRERKAANAKASSRARRARGTVIPVPAGYTGPLPGVSTAGVVALTPAARKRARKAAQAQAASNGTTTTVVVPVTVPAATTPAKPAKKAGKKRGKKAGKKAGRSPSAQARSLRTRRANKSPTEKFKLLHQFGIPRGTRSPLSGKRRGQLREAAGDRVSFNDIMTTIKNEKLKSWVCVGPRRTGCGGGAKNLRGGHQIGIFATAHR